MKIVEQLFANYQTALFTLFLILFSLGQLQRVELSAGRAFYLHDAVIVIFLITIAAAQKNIFKLQKIKYFFKKISKTHRFELFTLVWVLLSMLLGVWHGRIGLTAGLYLARLSAYGLFCWLLWRSKQLNFSPRNGFAVAGILIAGWGIGQYLLLPDARFLHVFGWDNHYYRLISTLLDPAFTGMVLVMAFIYLQSFDLIKINRKIFQLLQGVAIIAIAATFSRASYLGLLIATALLIKVQKINWRQSAALVILFITTLLLLPKPGGEGVNLSRTSTGEARLNNASTSLQYLQGSQWLWGRGLFNSDTYQNQPYETPRHAKLPDSLPVLLIHATGIIGTGLFTTLAAKWLPYWWERDPVWAIALIAVLLHSLFNNTLLQPFVFLMLWGGKRVSLR